MCAERVLEGLMLAYCFGAVSFSSEEAGATIAAGVATTALIVRTSTSQANTTAVADAGSRSMFAKLEAS